jgi:hypothetical protein
MTNPFPPAPKLPVRTTREGWEVIDFAEIIPSDDPMTTTTAACICDPNPTTTDGPQPECDVHGQPSAAYRRGRLDAARDIEDYGRSEADPDLIWRAALANAARIARGEPATDEAAPRG